MVDQAANLRAASKRWRDANPERASASRKRWYYANREKAKTARKRWYNANADKVSETGKILRQQLRREAIENYGGVCVRCGIDDHRLLCFDHVNDDGARMRRDKVHPSSGADFHIWLKKQGWPSFIQLLCYNCNALKQNYPESFDG